MRPGRATPEGTERFRRRFDGHAASGHFRLAGGLWVSSIGLGTYLGAADDATDAAYEQAVTAALAGGVNVFDTAINYRGERAERCLGRALDRAFGSGVVARDEVFVSTKGGFPPTGGDHSLEPHFLTGQLDRSRANLGVATVDLYHLHNPENRLESGEREDALAAIERAIAWTAEAREEKRIAAAGLATWSGLRLPPGDPAHLPLLRLHGPECRLAAIQLPVNLAMPEALAAPTQELDEATLPTLVVARFAGLSVFASASILQGKLAEGLPPEIAAIFPTLDSDAQRALQFTRSAPGITTALVGMSTPSHVAENLELVRHEPATPEELQALFAGGVG